MQGFEKEDIGHVTTRQLQASAGMAGNCLHTRPSATITKNKQ